MANNLAAFRDSIAAVMAGEAAILKWQGPPNFQQVADIAVRHLILERDYVSGMDWREVTATWVQGKLGKIEKVVAKSLGEEKIW